jgi:hypothetical protein
MASMGRHGIWDLSNLIHQVKSVCEITDDGCWLWRFGTWAEHQFVDEHRYPRLMIDGRRRPVAQWMLEASGYPQLPGMEECHSCDHPACVAPNHLRWDTHKANMQEMGERGRSHAQRYPENMRWGEDHPFRLHPERIPRGPRPGNYASGDDHWTRRSAEPLPWSGTSHHMARLTPEIVRSIRARAAAGEEARDIAIDLGVGRTTVRAVLGGRTWKHVA